MEYPADRPARVDFKLVRETFDAWYADKAPRLAAALSFSTSFFDPRR